MPRIAATGIVLALVAAAIGLNMARYPTVWQMVEPSSQSSPPEETARPAGSPRPATLAPAGGSRRDSAPEPVATASPRGMMTLPVSLGKADSAPGNPLRNEPVVGEPAELHGEPLAEYRRQRDANGIAADASVPPPAVAAPSSSAPPPAPQPPATMSATWPAEAATSPRVIASPAPLKTPELAKTFGEGDSPVFADTKTGTVPTETVERLAPVVRPVSAARTPTADIANPLRPLPPVDAAGDAAPAPLAPGVLQPIYPSTGMR